MGEMLVAVASERRCDPLVLMDEPLWRLLYHFHHVNERKARVTLHDRLERIDLGMLMARAFHEPQGLNDELRTVREALHALDNPSAAADEALRARGLALAARIEAGRVLSAEALVS